MAEQFIGEIRIFGFGFVPHGWMRCDGRLLEIAQNSALFAVLGTMYGGDGVKTFGLPHLCGRVPLQANQQYPLGSKGGEESHTLELKELPKHTHLMQAVTTAPNQPTPSMDLFAASPGSYTNKVAEAMSPLATQIAGNGMPHENRSPFLALNVAIAIEGTFPVRS